MITKKSLAGTQTICGDSASTDQPTRTTAGLLRVWLHAFLMGNFVEGLVFAHEDGRFAKIRRKDFGFAWPV